MTCSYWIAICWALCFGACSRNAAPAAESKSLPRDEGGKREAAHQDPTPQKTLGSSQAQETPAAEANVVSIAAAEVTVEDRRVRVSAFSMDRTEVTVAQYAACVQADKCSPPEIDDPLCNWNERSKRARHPVNCVTFGQAQSYCASSGRRLPSAAEWQLAAGGPEGRAYPWGSDHPSNLWVTDSTEPGPARHKLCWVGDGTDDEHRYPTSTCPVGSYREGDTLSGISDMAGNVWEWTTDTQTLPQGEVAHRVQGGGFLHDPMGPLSVRASDFEVYLPGHQAPDIGFRCVSI